MCLSSDLRPRGVLSEVHERGREGGGRRGTPSRQWQPLRHRPGPPSLGKKVGRQSFQHFGRKFQINLLTTVEQLAVLRGLGESTTFQTTFIDLGVLDTSPCRVWHFTFFDVSS